MFKYLSEVIISTILYCFPSTAIIGVEYPPQNIFHEEEESQDDEKVQEKYDKFSKEEEINEKEEERETPRQEDRLSYADHSFLWDEIPEPVTDIDIQNLEFDIAYLSEELQNEMDQYSQRRKFIRHKGKKRRERFFANFQFQYPLLQRENLYLELEGLQVNLNNLRHYLGINRNHHLYNRFRGMQSDLSMIGLSLRDF